MRSLLSAAAELAFRSILKLLHIKLFQSVWLDGPVELVGTVSVHTALPGNAVPVTGRLHQDPAALVLVLQGMGQLAP